MIIRSKYILSSALIMKMVVFGIFAADGTVLADEGVTITCPSDYPNIDSNATSENDCYKQCTTDDVANSMSVTGKNYYGSGTDTCEPTQCAAGWRINPSVNLLETLASIKGINSAYINNEGKFVGDITKFDGYYGIDSKNSFSVDFGDFGIVTGRALCSSVVGESGVGVWSNPLVFDSLADETGQYGASTCFCNIDGFISVDGSKRSVVSPWVGGYYFSAYTDCPQYCVRYCSYRLSTLENFRVKMFEQIDTLSPVCTEDVYRCMPGQYLRVAGSVAECVECPEGAYCPGGDFTLFSEYKGINSCPSDYPNSDAGSSADTSCYTSCDIKNISIEKATAVTGRDYYGFGADTCKISECIAGWEVKQHKSLYDIIGTGEGTNSAYISYSGIFQNGLGRDFVDREYYGMTKNNTWVAGYGDLGIVKGRAFCSKSYTYGGSYNDYPDETGQTGARNCYCRVEEYTNSEKKVQSVSAPWVLVKSYSDQAWADGVSSCQSSCVNSCAADLRLDGTNELELRKKLFSTAPVTYICEAITYTLNPGEYLPAGDEEPADCPSGYYCPGAGDVKYDEEKGQGLVACPSDYPNSDTGAKSENDCYKQCTTDDVVNSVSVVGKNYYGTGADTCAATECVAGWFVKDLTEIVGEKRGTNSASVNYYGNYNEQGASKGQHYYGITERNSFAVEYGEGIMIIGHGRCSTQPGVGILDGSNNPKDVTVVNNLIDETGNTDAKYCYCKIDEYTDMYGMKVKTLATPWFFRNAEKSSQECSTYCANSCGISLGDNGTFRIAMFEKAVPATCEAITYTLNPGEYLSAGGEEPVDCPNGSYCPGGETVYWNKDEDQGITVCPADYPNSDIGATSEKQCYKTCTTDDVAGAMTVVGTDYYGGLNTCDAKECIAGWRLKSGKTLADVIGTEPSINSASVNSSGSFSEVNYDNLGAKGRSYYGLNDNMSFAVDYGERGMVTGKSLCSTKGGTGANNGVSSIDQITRFDELVDETSSGTQYCYCKLDNYTPYGGVKQSVSTPWFLYDNVSACGLECSKYCASSLLHLSSSSFLAQALFNTVKVSGDTCEENGTYLPDGATEYVRCPDGYDNSDIGATSEKQCYKQCTTDDVAGAMTVSGQNYYGSNGKSCIATSCVAGWGVKSFINQIGTEYGLNSAYISTNSQSYGRFYEENFEGDGPKGQAYYGITDLGTFAVDYGENGIITGRGRCSTKPGVFDYDYDTEVLKELTVRDELYDETGQSGANYCYCQVDSYTPVGELTQVLSDMPWVFEDEFWSEFACNDNCAQSCAGVLRMNDTYSQKFRSAVFGEPNVCVQESYRMKVGIYLPAGASDAVICPSGSYCPGADSVIKNSNKNQGISECPTEYPYSDAGAVSASNCYKPCTTDDVVNSVSVTGRNYYGDGYDSCAATQCLADWKLQDFYGIVGDTEGVNSAYISTNSSSYGEFVEYNEPLYGQDYYGISEPGTFGVSYGDIGVITGRGRCSTKSGVGGVNPTRFKELDDESGVGGANYCYCQVDSYTPVGGLTQVLSDMPWVFKEESWSESGCSEYCAQSCAGGLKPAYEEVLAFRSAVFGYASCNEEVYRVNPGDYLPEREESPSECPSGSFCSGTTGVSSRPDKSQGISGCPSEYPYSDAGAKTKSQCYRDCTGDDVANAMTAVGRNYYGDGVDTCIATDCVSGWHLKPGINLEELVGSVYEGSNSEYMAGTNSAYINNAGEFIEYDMYDENHSQDYYGISEKNSFAVGYGEKGIITGRARCSEMSDEKLDEITDEFGVEGVENCYCRIDSYVSADGIKQSISAPWLYLEWLGGDGPETCTDYCVEYCAAYMREYTHLDFRGKMFDAAYELPVCSVNQININWNLGYGDNNVSTTTCFYTDVIEYPTDPVRPGYTFTGWKLVE